MIFGTTDPTVPMPAPHGYKWHIRTSGSTELFFLQLWRQKVAIPDDTLSQMIGCEVEVYFTKEKHIRHASRRAIRDLEQKLAAEERERRILALNGRLK